MKNKLLENVVYDEIKISFKQRIYNFLYAKGIIMSHNWMYGGK